MKRILFYIILTSFFTEISFSQGTTLIINELSQGNATQEYVEFLVVSTQTNSCIKPTLDLRKWIFDDNNGYFKPGSGSGIAAGALRFADNPFWSAIPAGTLILIYNSDDFDNTVIPAQDLSMSDGNCTLIIPSSSNLLEKNSLPDNTNSAYPTTGWTTGGDWANVAMRNAGDAFQIYSPTNTSTPVHSVSFGDNNLHQDIYFSGAASGLVYSFDNTTSDNYHTQANWTSKPIASGQTPGSPNSANNLNYINTQSHNCSNVSTSTLDITANIVQNTTCNQANGKLSSTPTGGTTPYTFSWSDGTTSQNISNAASGNYTVYVTDASGCKDSAQITLPVSAAGPTLTLNAQNVSCSLSNGSITSTTTNGTQPYSYLWTSGDTSANLNNLSVGNYQLTVTDNAGCIDTKSVTITQNAGLNVTINANPQVISEGGSSILTANTLPQNGTFTYSWTPNNDISCTNCQQTTVNPENNTIYTVIVTDSAGCTGQDTVLIQIKKDCGEVFIPNVFSPNGDNINDEFKIQGKCIIGGSLSIFNRWGEAVFKTGDITKDVWDGKFQGKEVTTGVYFYISDVQTLDNNSKQYSGMVTVTR